MATYDVIAIGASAGGVEAVTHLCAQLPRKLSAAVMVVIHVSPQSKRYMAEILNRHCELTAVYPEDGEAIRPGYIYVAPPDHHMTVENERLRIIRGPLVNRNRPAIDVLFRSVAREYGARAIGVVLTGFLDDGSAGLALIKGAGGVAIIQDPIDARSSSMPKEALAKVEPDFCVPVAGMGEVVIQLTGAAEGKERPMGTQKGAKGDGERGGTPRAASMNEAKQISPYTCPDCHGTIFEVKEGQEEVRFECHVGHSYSPDAMFAANNDDLERALWVAVRTLQESAALGRRLAEYARQRKRERAVEYYELQSRKKEQHANMLRELLMRGDVGSPGSGQTEQRQKAS